MPIVLLGGHVPDAPYDQVIIDGMSAGRTAVRHLLGLGRERIGVIGMRGEDHRLYQGVIQAHEEAARVVNPRYLTGAGPWRRADGAAAMRRLLALTPPPDAVFCFNDTLAMGAMSALHEAGRRIPDDVAVIGVDDIEEGQFAMPPLTTIAPDKVALGHLAVSLLISRIQGKRDGKTETFAVPFELRLRKSA